MKRILGNRGVRRCILGLCMIAEPCIHVFAMVNGTPIPHVEGMSSYAVQALMSDV